MRFLITAGPTREPIDAVRYIGNRSSGQMGAALAGAALEAGHVVTLILGPVSAPMPPVQRRIDIETAAQMHEAVLREFPGHEVLIMAAAVADYRPKTVHSGKIGREGSLVIECEATEDILAAASKVRQPHQRIVGFSLEAAAGVDRAREKLHRKGLDLIVYNPLATMNSPSIEAVLLWPDGRSESLASRRKAELADILLKRVIGLYATSAT
jgi:phosphopantothenoylcysteine decarboxylase/phosphopantothenate--cysteine ligase